MGTHGVFSIPYDMPEEYGYFQARLALYALTSPPLCIFPFLHLPSLYLPSPPTSNTCTNPSLRSQRCQSPQPPTPRDLFPQRLPYSKPLPYQRIPPSQMYRPPIPTACLARFTPEVQTTEYVSHHPPPSPRSQKSKDKTHDVPRVASKTPSLNYYTRKHKPCTQS